MPHHIFPPLSALAVLAAAAAHPALAADIPGGPGTTARLPVSRDATRGAFETIGDSDWYRVMLVGGRDYAVLVAGGVESGGNVQASLRDAGGRVLASATSSDNESQDGFEFHAPRSGLYFLEYEQTFGDVDTGPFGYSARISGDCRDAAATRCTIAPGDTKQGLFGFGTDADRFGTSLVGGRRYTIRTEATGGLNEGTVVSLLDRKGKKLAGGTGPNITGFRAPRSGTYYLRVRTADAVCCAGGNSGTYTVSLAAR